MGRQPEDVLVPELPALRRVGHKGADLIVPGNTPASFDAALTAGVDMIEFDVLPERRDAPETSRLVLAHDYEHVAGAPRRRPAGWCSPTTTSTSPARRPWRTASPTWPRRRSGRSSSTWTSSSTAMRRGWSTRCASTG